MADFSAFDHPSIISYLFYPRREAGPLTESRLCHNLSIPVDKDTAIGGKVFIAGAESPSILFFHGNGEIVADYDDLGPLFAGDGHQFHTRGL